MRNKRELASKKGTENRRLKKKRLKTGQKRKKNSFTKIDTNS